MSEREVAMEIAAEFYRDLIERYVQHIADWTGEHFIAPRYRIAFSDKQWKELSRIAVTVVRACDKPRCETRDYQSEIKDLKLRLQSAESIGGEIHKSTILEENSQLRAERDALKAELSRHAKDPNDCSF